MTMTTTINIDQQRARQAIWASLGLIVLLTAAKSLGFSPLAQKIGFSLVAAYQLYLPLWIIDRGRERAHDYGLHMHGSVAMPLAILRRKALAQARHYATGTFPRRSLIMFSRFVAPYCHNPHYDPPGLKTELRQLGLVMLLTFPPFVIGHHFWQVWLASLRHQSATYHFGLPHNFLEIVLINLLLIALPEELFYRGFVQTRLMRAWPAKVQKFAVPIGRALVVSSALFALGHYVGEWGNPARLGPFFPALLFFAMRARSKSIMGAVLYHGLSNILSESLRAGYTFH